MAAYRIEFYNRPGLTRSERECEALISDLRGVGKQCFSELPAYQCLSGTPRDLTNKVITVARDADGRIGGFCSAALLPVYGLGEVFHLGLTCVSPAARGHGLTHRLTSRNLTQYILKHRPFGKTWISNVACVLSSLGNVAMYFEDVYPSPLGTGQPSKNHVQIAKAINLHYRNDVYISDQASLDLERFVFRASVKNTVFQKSESDVRYYHRFDWMNHYYKHLMQFEHGDEVLQIGYVTLLTALKHKLKRKLNHERARMAVAATTAPAQ